MPRNIYRYIFIVLGIVILGFTLGYLKTFVSLDIPDKNNTKRENQNVSRINQVRLTPQAGFIFKTYYTKCGHEKIEKKLSNDKFSGYTKKQLANEMKNWEIESFTPKEVVLKRQVENVCDKHYFIGIKDGYVALFQGRPALPSKIIEKTDIIVDVLKEEDRAILEKGLVINNKREFLKIKEGLTS